MSCFSQGVRRRAACLTGRSCVTCCPHCAVGPAPGTLISEVKLLRARGARLGWQSPDGLLCAGAGSESDSCRCVYWSEMLSFLIENTSFKKCCFIWASCSWKVQSLCCGTFMACCFSVMRSLYNGSVPRKQRNVGAWLMSHQSCGRLPVPITVAQLCVVRGFTSGIFSHLGKRFQLCETLLLSEEVKMSTFANTSCSGRGQALLQGRSDPAHPVPWLWAGLGPRPSAVLLRRAVLQLPVAAAGDAGFSSDGGGRRTGLYRRLTGIRSSPWGVGGKTIIWFSGRALDEGQTLLHKHARNGYPSENPDYRTGINLQVRTFVSSKMPELVS